MLPLQLMRIPLALLFFLCCLVAPCFGPLAWAQKGKQQYPPVYLPGHYWLADGIRREGLLCLVSDNELLVKSADTARSKQYAAVHVRNFVIAADSFTVLRNIDVNVNSVITRYPSAMVQVIRPVQFMPLYRLRGPMDVFAPPTDQATLMVLRGISGGAAGIAGGMLADEMRSNSAKRSKEKMMTLWVLRPTPESPLETIQPQTAAARTRLLALVASNGQLAAQLQKMPGYSLTEGEILRILGQFFVSATQAGR